MGKTKELILGNEPLDESEIIAELDLYHVEMALGLRDETISVVEGLIQLGKHHIYSVQRKKQRPHTGSSKRSTRSGSSISAKWDFYIVRIPFTVPELGKSKNYESVRFYVSVTNKDITALDMLPANVTIEQDVTQSFVLSPEVTFEKVGVKVGQIGRTIQFKSLKPVISAFGGGTSEFYWLFGTPPGGIVIPETKHVLAVLEVPGDAKILQGRVKAEATIVQTRLGVLKSHTTETVLYPFEWQLSEAEPF